MKIGVIGLGKIGLPLAVQYATSGHDVIGIDVDDRVVQSVNAATAPFPGEAGLELALSDVVAAGRLRATTDYARGVPDRDAVVVVVPLFVDGGGTPAFDWMDAATDALGDHLTPDTLVAYETTLPVGTTRSRWHRGSRSVPGSSRDATSTSCSLPNGC